MNKTALSLICALSVLITAIAYKGFAQEPTEPQTKSECRLEIPRIQPGEKTVDRTGYAMSFDTKHNLAKWIAYKLTKIHLENPVTDRKGEKFKPDTDFPQALTPEQYTGSGFDRGHLLPAGDARWSEEAMNDSFLMGNVAPQAPQLNQQRWNQLEEFTRQKARQLEELFVVTGPILDDKDGKFRGTETTLPSRFFKVLLQVTEKSAKAIGFIMSQSPTVKGLKPYAVSIQDVEKATSLDFFSCLPDQVEEATETELDFDYWLPTTK